MRQDANGNNIVQAMDSSWAQLNNFNGPVYLSQPAGLRGHYDIGYILHYYAQLFVGREVEHQYLVNFSLQQKPGYLLVKAPPGYGKSALAANFIQQYTTNTQTAGVRLLYYFIRQNENKNTAQDFLQVVNLQLLSLLNLPGGVTSELDSLRLQFSELWHLANEEASQASPLLLLIDGLDEMADGDATVATELPTELRDYVHIVITSRPNPNPQQHVIEEHPLRQAQILELHPLNLHDIRQAVATSVFSLPIADDVLTRIYNVTHGEPIYLRAVLQDVITKGVATLAELEYKPPAGVQTYFQNQLAQLDKLTNHELTWEILGLLTVTIGGISQDELADLLRVAPRHIYRATKPIARFLLGEERQELMHWLFRTAVEAELPKSRDYYQQKLVQWCKSYQEQYWPNTTPMYILDNYAAHLIAIRDHRSLYALVDKRWMQLKRQRTGAHVAFAQDMEKVIDLAATAEATDWEALIGSCLAYTTVVTRSATVDYCVLKSLVHAGESKKAYHYTTLISDIRERCRAYSSIAEACIKVGELTTALLVSEEWAQVAFHSENEDILSPSSDQIGLLHNAQRAVQLAAAGEFDKAIQVAEVITDELISHWTRFRIAQQMANLGQKQRAYALTKTILKGTSFYALTFNFILAQAHSVGVFRGERKKYFLSQDVRKYTILAPEELGRWHDATYVEELLQTRLQEGWENWGVTEYNFNDLAVNLISSKNQQGFRRLLAVVQTITDKETKTYTLCKIANALATHFHIEQALEVIDKIPNWYEIDRIQPLGAVTEAVILTGDLQQLNYVLQKTWLIYMLPTRIEALCEISNILATHLHLDKARYIANIALELCELGGGRLGATGYEDAKVFFQNNLFDMLCNDGKIDKAAALIEGAWNADKNGYGQSTTKRWLDRILEIVAHSDQCEFVSILQPVVENVQARLREVAEHISNIPDEISWKYDEIKRFREESTELGNSFVQVKETCSDPLKLSLLHQTIQADDRSKNHKHRHESLVSAEKQDRLYRINRRGERLSMGLSIDRVNENSRLFFVENGARLMAQVGSLEELRELSLQKDSSIIKDFAYWLADTESIDLLEQALRVYEDPYYGTSAMLSAMTYRMAETRNHKGLRRLLVLTQETELSINIGVTVGLIGMAMIESGDEEGFRQALALATTLNRRNGYCNDALELIAPALAEIGRFDDAAKIALQFNGYRLDKSIFEEIRIHLLSANSIEEAFPKIVNALQIARRFSRERIFQVLDAAQYWFMYIDDGDTAWRIYQAVEAVENWWSFDKTLEELKARLDAI